MYLCEIKKMLSINRYVLPTKGWVHSGMSYDTHIEPARHIANTLKSEFMVKKDYNVDTRYTGNRSYEEESAVLESQSVYSHPSAYIKQGVTMDNPLSYRIPRSGNQPIVVGTANNIWQTQFKNTPQEIPDDETSANSLNKVTQPVKKPTLSSSYQRPSLTPQTFQNLDTQNQNAFQRQGDQLVAENQRTSRGGIYPTPPSLRDVIPGAYPTPPPE